MTVAERKPRRRIFGWLLLLAGLALAWPAYRMFEPVLTWSSGWQPLPADAAIPHGTGVADVAWSGVAVRADEQLRDARSRLQAPALSAAIMIDGKRVWAAATGYADLEQARPATIDSIFRLGSTSKAINALAMARLIDSGKLDIDRSVRTYLPDLPATYDRVTTRLAVSHTAGIPDYGLCLCFPIWEHLNRRHFDSVRTSLHVFEDRPLLSAPGEAFHYSSYSANVVGAVVEAAAQRPYLAWVEEGVLQPLGMRHTRADLAGAAIPERVSFYDITENRYKPAEPVDNSIRYPSGGLLSTPSDILLVGNAFLGGDFLAQGTRQQLLTRQKLRDGSDNPQGYALGIRVFDDKKLFDGRVQTRFYSHHGTAVGSTSYFGVYPEYGLVVSVMMNKGQENMDALAEEANRLVELFIAEKLRRAHPDDAFVAPGAPAAQH